MYAKPQAESRFAVAATPSWLASGIPWLWKGMLAFAEAGLISGSNFFTGILLARWLSAEQYGAYAFSFSIFLLCASLYQALLLEPMSVLGPSTYFGREREYLGALLWLHGFIGLTITIVLGATALLLRIMTAHGDVVEAMAGLAVASPFIL